MQTDYINLAENSSKEENFFQSLNLMKNENEKFNTINSFFLNNLYNNPNNTNQTNKSFKTFSDQITITETSIKNIFNIPKKSQFLNSQSHIYDQNISNPQIENYENKLEPNKNNIFLEEVIKIFN